MTPSQTKQRQIARLRANVELHVPTLLSTPTSPGDLSRDQATRPLPPTVIEHATSALEDGHTHYVPVTGIAPLREKVADYLQAHGQHHVAADNVLITAGIQEARFLTIQKIGEKMGGLAMPAVVHPGARQASGVRSLAVVQLPVDNGSLLPTLEGIRQALKDGRRLLYLESPSRLTGATYDGAAIAEIAQLITAYDAVVVWDQGLSPWVAPGAYASFGTEAAGVERVAVIGELWPGIGLESWFVGFVAAAEQWLEGAGIRAHKQMMSICTSTPTQYAALAAADNYERWRQTEISRLKMVRDAAVAKARSLGAEPLPGTAVNQLALRLADAPGWRASLSAAGYTVADGRHFGRENILRFAVTGDGAINRALDCIVAGR